MKALLLSASVLLCGSAVSQVFTTSGVFVVPPGINTIQVELVGPGGNGGSNGAGGGGGGGYTMGTLQVVPGTSYPVTVGQGGSGTATTLGGTALQATAGGNGGMVQQPNVGGGGTAGTGLGGDVNFTGGAGGGGYYTYFGGGGGGAAGPNGNGGIGGNTIVFTGMCLTPGGVGGIGGGAPGGDGGKGAGFTDANCNITDPAANGANYGGGGGGGNGNGGNRGTGGGGYCLITWEGFIGISEGKTMTESMVLNNPFTEHIVVTHVIGNEHFTLFDATGRQLWSGVHIEQQDFSALRSGTYILRMEAGNTARNFKVTKQ